MDIQNNLEPENVYISLRSSGVYEEDKKLCRDGNDLNFDSLVHASSRERLCEHENVSNTTPTLNIPLGIYREIANPAYNTQDSENRTSLTYEAPPQPEENAQHIYAEIERKTTDVRAPVNTVNGVTPPAVSSVMTPAQTRAESVTSSETSNSSAVVLPIPMKLMKNRACPGWMQLLARVVVVVLVMALCFGFGLYVGKDLMKGK